MDPLTFLRALVAAEIVVTAGGVMVAFLLDGFLPQQLQVYLAAEQEAPLQALEVVVLLLALPLLGATVAAWIGIWRSWKYAPSLYLASRVGTVLLLLLMAPPSRPRSGPP